MDEVESLRRVAVTKYPGFQEWDAQSRWRKYIEIKLNRLAAEVGGGAGAQAERVTAIMDEIDELRRDLTAATERVDRMAEFLNELREERKNGGEG